MSDLRAGDTVEFVIEAEVETTYRDSDRVKLRWHSGEETVLPSDVRMNPHNE